MNNIFENAYFGKAYKTRDGRRALFLAFIDDCIVEAIIEGEHTTRAFLLNGCSRFYVNQGSVDIVEEWQEEINEEELDKLAEEYERSVYDGIMQDASISARVVDKKSFKAGYCKAKKGGKNE